MLGLAAQIPEAAARDQFADRLAHKARVLEDVVRTEIRRAAVARRTTLKSRDPVSVRVTPAEKGLIWAARHDTKAAQGVLSGLEDADLEGLSTSAILGTLLDLAEWPPDVVWATLLERLDDDV